MPSSVSLVCVDPEKIFDFWPHARPLIKAALERTRLSNIEDIETDVLEGRQLLWLAWSDHIEAAATTHLSAGVCTLTACSGHQRERWLPLFEHIEKYAKDECCSTMRIFGRKGWERVLDGYHVEHVVLEKRL
jgi:hypothetical protein